MGRTAHLVVWLRTDTGIPSVIDCHIHSSGPSSLRGYSAGNTEWPHPKKGGS